MVELIQRTGKKRFIRLGVEDRVTLTVVVVVAGVREAGSSGGYMTWCERQSGGGNRRCRMEVGFPLFDLWLGVCLALCLLAYTAPLSVRRYSVVVA